MSTWRPRTNVRRFSRLPLWVRRHLGEGQRVVAQLDHPDQGTLSCLYGHPLGLCWLLTGHDDLVRLFTPTTPEEVPTPDPGDEPLAIPLYPHGWIDTLVACAPWWQVLTPPPGWPANDRSEWCLPPGGSATYPRWIGEAICLHLLLAGVISMEITQEFDLERGTIIHPIETTDLLVGMGHPSLGTIWFHQTAARDRRYEHGRGACAYVWHTPGGAVLWYVPRHQEILDPEGAVPPWFDHMVYTAPWKELEVPHGTP